MPNDQPDIYINILKKDYIREKYKAIKYKLGFYLYCFI